MGLQRTQEPNLDYRASLVMIYTLKLRFKIHIFLEKKN